MSDTVPGPTTQAVKINLIGQRAELTFKQAEQAGLHPLLHTTLQAFVQPLLPAFLPRYGKTGF